MRKVKITRSILTFPPERKAEVDDRLKCPPADAVMHGKNGGE